jgi:hypothetical protein
MRYHVAMVRALARCVPGARPIAAAAFLALALVPAGAPPESAPASIPVEDWSKQANGHQGIPEGWKGQNWGSPKYDLRVVADGGGKVLHMRSENEGSTISKEIKVDVKQYPYLSWRWKALVLPRGGDSRHAATDDQACQVYVTFPRFPTAVRSRIIGYIWDTTAPAGLMTTSQKTRTVHYVIARSGPAEVGRWIAETRNVLEDFRKVHGEAPAEDVGAVSIGIDSNDVRDRAECVMGEITFKKQP